MGKIIITFILLILFRVGLDYTYINFLSKYFGEFPLNINGIKVFESYVLTIVLVIVLIKWFHIINAPSFAAIYILVLNLLFPLLSYYSLTNGSRTFIYSSIGSILIVMIFVRFLNRISLKYLKENLFSLFAIIIIVAGICIMNLIINGGLSRLSFDLLKVYEVREQYLQSNGFMMGYFLPWTAYSINTMILAYCLFKKKRMGVIFSIGFQVFIYATTGFKSFLFAPLLIIVIHLALNKFKTNRLLPFLTLGFIALISYSYLTFIFNNDIVTGSIFIRRNFFAPAQIHFLYHEFFSNPSNPLVMLSDSIFRAFIDNPYSESSKVIYHVSEHFYGREFGLNVGYIGNAYMNFGYFGIFIFSILLGFILKTLDSISTSLPLSVSVSSIIIPSMAFINSGLLTVLLTHGFLFSCLCLWLLSGANIKSKKQLKRKTERMPAT